MLPKLEEAEARLTALAGAYSESACGAGGLKPVVYFCSRIKAPDSVLRKCGIRGVKPNLQAAYSNFFDLVGIRIVCAFSADVYKLAEWLRTRTEIRIVEEKDYYANPKPNGYRSFHVLLKLLPEEIPAEIQIRTIATDFWATLEHRIKYKKEVKSERMIREELKRCADEIASVDISMQTIREIIEGTAEPAYG